ncbi:Metallophos domain-containing protein [Mycena sanguinolenta]|uniref:Metallophos domain-containing protein n=1 Tax=Mycena sanguinolenta TaxID=230812 RepID=A0A8H6XQ19_9AGAR|nr:Metallophos domain-containing protein [Mycena sanguinolenta]
MWFFQALPLVFTGVAIACNDEHAHSHSHVKREFPSVPLTPPSRPLQWGSLNIIHTTDSHGWLLGHQKASFPEPNYSGDFGDFASFVAHMKVLALEKDVDLLLVDSGDLHDGTGLSDGFPPGGVDGHASNQFFKELPYENFAPHFPGRYLSSNVNITVGGVSVPVGNRFAKFKTRKGRSVTSVGVLYDFTDNDVGTTVQFVADMVQEEWFSAAIEDEPDLFLLVGHMPVRFDNWPLVYNAIRAVHPLTPILILGGHSHVRDCLQFDGRSIALESGRYMETVGWMSADLPPPGTRPNSENITFSRRYLDPNRVTYEFHTGQRNFSFDTVSGRSITKGLEQLAVSFDLAFEYGVAPNDFLLSRFVLRVIYFQAELSDTTSAHLTPPTTQSYHSWLRHMLFFTINFASQLISLQAMPVALTINNTRAGNPHVMITNSGEMRFDIFAGTFTKNDQLTASPFADSFLFIPDVPFSAASAVLPALNGPSAKKRRRDQGVEAELWARGYVEARYREWLEEMYQRDLQHRGEERRAAENLTLGYVTTDVRSHAPGVGDDVPHTPLPFFSSPGFIASALPDVADDTPIDLVFIDFIESELLETLNSLQTDKVYTTADVSLYSDVLLSQALGLYAQQVWN